MLADTKVYYKPSDNTIHVMCYRQGVIYDKHDELIEDHRLSSRYTACLCSSNIHERNPIVNSNIVPLFAYGTWQLPDNCWNGGFEKDIRDSMLLKNATYRKWWVNFRNKLVSKYPNILQAQIIKE